MSFYLFLNFIIIALPLGFSFVQRLKFYSKIRPLLITLLLVGVIFVAWDVFATSQDHWTFNPKYVGETRVLGLPLEELLFFVTVPYSCLFVFEAIQHFSGDKQLFPPSRQLFIGIGGAVVLFSLAFLNQGYTFLAVLSVGITFLFISSVNLKIFASRAFWIYTLLTLVLFLIFNYILTSYPVVQYSSTAITGFRITTIPIEDFLFNFSMLTNYLTVYIWASRKMKITNIRST